MVRKSVGWTVSGHGRPARANPFPISVPDPYRAKPDSAQPHWHYHLWLFMIRVWIGTRCLPGISLKCALESEM